jgi:hypothetical protein
MKTSTLILPLLLCTAAFADITMVQHTFIGAAQTPMKTTMYAKDGKMRTDSDTTTTLIIDSKTGDMTTLVHEQKMIIKQNTKELEALAQQMPKTVKPEETQVTATGQKEKIDGYDCELFLSENSGTVVKMWVTRNYPGQEKLRTELKVLTELSARGAPKQPDVPGIAVKTEFEQQGLKFTTRLVSLDLAPVDDALFVIPEGYKAPGE